MLSDFFFVNVKRECLFSIFVNFYRQNELEVFENYAVHEYVIRIVRVFEVINFQILTLSFGRFVGNFHFFVYEN